MRAPGGNRTVASPVVSQWQSCHIVKDTPWVDAGIHLSFRTIRGFFGVQCGILRLIVWAKCKRNHLLFDRLGSDVRDKRSPFIKYENTGTLSPKVNFLLREKLSRRDYLDYLKNRAKSGDISVLELTFRNVSLGKWSNNWSCYRR